MGRYSVHLVGESNYKRSVGNLHVGDRIELIHEPSNRYDPRAVIAKSRDGATIGYVERDSWVQRVVIDEGQTLYAEVEAIIGGEKGKPSKGVMLLVATATDAEELLVETAEARSARLKKPGEALVAPAPSQQ